MLPLLGIYLKVIAERLWYPAAGSPNGTFNPTAGTYVGLAAHSGLGLCYGVVLLNSRRLRFNSALVVLKFQPWHSYHCRIIKPENWSKFPPGFGEIYGGARVGTYGRGFTHVLCLSGFESISGGRDEIKEPWCTARDSFALSIVFSIFW